MNGLGAASPLLSSPGLGSAALEPGRACAALIMHRVTPGSSRQNAETEVNHYLETKEGSLHPN